MSAMLNQAAVASRKYKAPRRRKHVEMGQAAEFMQPPEGWVQRYHFLVAPCEKLWNSGQLFGRLCLSSVTDRQDEGSSTHNGPV
jgi:hypothetical protein